MTTLWQMELNEPQKRKVYLQVQKQITVCEVVSE